jgi:flavin reductase (DIM6/NTAB) family NADH-FMN oxidoreductase RutF
MKHMTRANILDLEKRYRANLINSLSGPKSANLIGTQNKEGLTNLALFSSAFHLGADPALMGLISRPNSVPRHTLENLQETGVYTVNHVTEAFYEAAHLTSARTNISEFELTGLTPSYIDTFGAPFVAESPVQIGLEWVRTLDIEENGTHMIIGRIVHIRVAEDAIEDDGTLDISQTGSIAVTGLDTYHRLEKLGKLPYAKAKT